MLKLISGFALVGLLAACGQDVVGTTPTPAGEYSGVVKLPIEYNGLVLPLEGTADLSLSPAGLGNLSAQIQGVQILKVDGTWALAGDSLLFKGQNCSFADTTNLAGQMAAAGGNFAAVIANLKLKTSPCADLGYASRSVAWKKSADSLYLSGMIEGITGSIGLAAKP